MPHRIVATDRAPRAIGPYSQAVSAGDTTYFSGQIALDPETGAVAAGADVAEETRRVMENLLAVVEAAGHRADEIVKCTIYLVDLADFARVNEAYAEALGGHRPARATVQVSRLPKDVRVEIDAVAIRSR